MITDLNNFDLLAIEGIDAGKFLQGQLTCNVETASATQSILGAYCNLTGRVISDLRLIPYETGIYLLCQKAMAEVLKTTLDKYIVFSKAKTHIVTDDFLRFGVHGQDALATLKMLNIEAPTQRGAIVSVSPGFVYCADTQAPRYELLIKTGQKDLLKAIEDLGVNSERNEWEMAEIGSGLVHIDAHMQDSYTPQILNYDLLGLVDFKKGCYTGQEIIARMHYRGKAKKRLYLGESDQLTLTPNTQLHIAGESVGEILRFANDQNASSKFLAIVPCEAVQDGSSVTLVDGTQSVQLQRPLILAALH